MPDSPLNVTDTAAEVQFQAAIERPDVWCPVNPGQVCSYRRSVVRQYKHAPTQPTDPAEIGIAHDDDDRLMKIKLAEHWVAARTLGCSATEGECQVATTMRDSQTRTAAKTVLHRLFPKLGGSHA